MDALDAYDAIPAAAVEAACLSYESAAIAEGYEPVSSRGTYQMRAWMTAALTAALPHLSGWRRRCG